MLEANRQLALRSFSEKQELMTGLVQWFIDANLVVRNPVTEEILAKLDEIRTVADMAAVACISARLAA